MILGQYDNLEFLITPKLYVIVLIILHCVYLQKPFVSLFVGGGNRYSNHVTLANSRTKKKLTSKMYEKQVRIDISLQ